MDEVQTDEESRGEDIDEVDVPIDDSRTEPRSIDSDTIIPSSPPESTQTDAPKARLPLTPDRDETNTPEADGSEPEAEETSSVASYSTFYGGMVCNAVRLAMQRQF